MDFEISKILINNEELTAMPSKRDDVTITPECTNGVTGTWNKETWSMDLANFTKTTSCTIKISASSNEVVDDVKADSARVAAEEAARRTSNTIVDGGSSGGTVDGGTGSQTIVDNPATGTFLNIFLILAIIGLAVFVIKKYSKKNKFYKI